MEASLKKKRVVEEETSTNTIGEKKTASAQSHEMIDHTMSVKEESLVENAQQQLQSARIQLSHNIAAASDMHGCPNEFQTIIREASIPLEKKWHKLDIRRAVKEYIKRTASFRHMEALFMSFHPKTLAFTCHDTGATVLAYAPKHQLLISGGRKGYTCLIDLRQKQQRQFFQSHDSSVKAIAVDPTEEYFVTGSAEGNIKSIFRNLGTGVMQIETGPANHIFSCGADGTVKMRILPDRFNSFSDILKTDVKLML
ncbi:hypothetical protein JD844_008948 [Phrynosoma platyrhinos]|uniref:Uncharacterized protein n=1 Tax=Phrynosoma platyrhinos TaxID=52577 RepID=A0ABQ7TEJ8_PHRPL|nr:hypothetical protein JD844_008948 [Phrynosoma platyrhinos]